MALLTFMTTAALHPSSAAADPRWQRQRYTSGFYSSFRRLKSLFAYAGRYRLLLAEEAFRRHNIPFERLKVFELGFGLGELLLRFDSTCSLHGCELSEDAIDALKRDPRLTDYRETRFVLSAPDGSPRFPSLGYDMVIASHVLEHVPDDHAALSELAVHTKVGGWGLLFLPLERPRHNPDHARIYTAAGVCELLRKTGWEPVEVSENFRYASHWVQVINWPSRARLPVIGIAVEVLKSVAMNMAPASVMRLVEGPLERLHVRPIQLMVLARRMGPVPCAA